MGLPAIVARAFPGNREEANRAGITPRIRVCTIDHSIARNCGARAKTNAATRAFFLAQARATWQTTRLSGHAPALILRPSIASDGLSPSTWHESRPVD